VQQARNFKNLKDLNWNFETSKNFFFKKKNMTTALFIGKPFESVAVQTLVLIFVAFLWGITNPFLKIGAEVSKENKKPCRSKIFRIFSELFGLFTTVEVRCYKF
jgi:hypothetical protein